MNKEVKELKEQLKRERLDSLSADKQWQDKVMQLNKMIAELSLQLEMCEADCENKTINPNEGNKRVYTE